MCVINTKKLKVRVENAFEFFFLGYGWKAFLLRFCAVVLSLKFNSFDDTANYTSSGPIKLFLLTCAFLAYAIFMLIYDYSKAGKEAEAKKRNEQAR